MSRAITIYRVVMVRIQTEFNRSSSAVVSQLIEIFAIDVTIRPTRDNNLWPVFDVVSNEIDKLIR